MPLYTLDPLLDERWEDLVATHPHASAFHTRGWLKALAKTYGYRPLALTSSPPGQRLSDGAAFCEIQSWITGPRLVSLPFADHAEPLFGEGTGAAELREWAQTASSQSGWKYVEIRPVAVQPEWTNAFETTQSFWLHVLSLTPSIGDLYAKLHKDCFRRRIKHAEREQLEYERGDSSKLVQEFYELLVITRKRHQLLPQPLSWFRNLVTGTNPKAEIRLVRKGGIPVAAIFTLRHRNTVIYKYGCSDHRLHHLAGMPLLFWKLIEESKAEGASQVDLGRTEPENAGLIEFKDRLGATRSSIRYLRYSKSTRPKSAQLTPPGVVARLFEILPGTVSSAMGSIVYRHIG